MSYFFIPYAGQWKDLIAKLAATGTFKNTQAICDVSGSMEGTPMEVAIALGLVVAELTQEPFRNKLITFHEQPTLHTITGDSLRDRVTSVAGMPWGGNTDLLAVFKLLLTEAENNPNAQMVEKLFIFSDMQFDEAAGVGQYTPAPAYNYGVPTRHLAADDDKEEEEEMEVDADEPVAGDTEKAEEMPAVVASAVSEPEIPAGDAVKVAATDETPDKEKKDDDGEGSEDRGFGLFDDYNEINRAERIETTWATTYESICRMFASTRFAVPKIIFWNLRATHKSFPVQKDEVGTALISGFSAQMMKAFLAGDMVEFSPVSIMNEVLDKYEITPVPQQERVPIHAAQAGSECFATVDERVEEFLVPKKVSRKTRRQTPKDAAPEGGDGDHGSDDDDE